MNDKQHDEALTDAYRRASAGDADRPGAATRAAILAEAAAVARRNAPAANESRYWLSALAGIAVLGIGVVLWRQTDYRSLEEAPQVSRAPVALDSVPKAESATLPEGASLPESPPETERAVVEKRSVESVRADAVVSSPSPAPEPFPASPAAAPSPTQSPVTEPSPSQLALNKAEQDLDEISITGTRIQAPNSERAQGTAAAPRPPIVGGAPRAGGAPGGGRAGGGGPGGGPPRTLVSPALLREYFPAQYQSDTSHSVWMVLNAAGEVLQSGELAPGQRAADLAPQLTRALGDAVPGTWQTQTLRNMRGQPIEVSIARLP